MDEASRYLKHVLEKEEAWEALCRRCGSCCGALEDPCEHLRQGPGNEFYCQIYKDRFGLHRSGSGKAFRCVPIRDILYKSWKDDHLCPYKGGLKYI